MNIIDALSTEALHFQELIPLEAAQEILQLSLLDFYQLEEWGYLNAYSTAPRPIYTWAQLEYALSALEGIGSVEAQGRIAEVLWPQDAEGGHSHV